MGVPRGSVLSVTLFSIEIKSIVDFFQSSTIWFFFVDEFTISFGLSHMEAIESHLHNYVRNLDN